MKVYYILSALSIEEKTFFLDSIKNLKQPTDIDELVKTRYYRVNKKTENTTDNTIILETWMFIKSIWLNYGVSPDKINWVHNQNMAILNDDLWIYDNTKYSWDKISVEENIYFFTSRYGFYNVFWSLWEKLSKINKNFPKLIYPNKDLYYRNHEKIKFIVDIYEKRKKFVGNFMLPVLYDKSMQSMKDLLLLRKNETGRNDLLLKKSWGTDNGKHITLINIDEYVNDDQKIDYLYLKYLYYANWSDSQIFFVDFYEIDKEYRLYYTKDKNNGKYKYYSAKGKINLTQKEEMFKKAVLRTAQEVKVKWELLDLDNIPKEIQTTAEYILKKNNLEVGAIELVKQLDGSIRFLEVNCLGGSLMFEGQDEENMKNMIMNWWNYLYNKDDSLKKIKLDI